MASRWSSAAIAAVICVSAAAPALADAIDTFVAQLVAEEREHLLEDGGDGEAPLRAEIDRVALDNDGRMDFILTWRGSSHCAERGCRVDVFLATDAAPGWRKVYEMTGGGWRLDGRGVKGHRDILHPAFRVGGRMVQQVARWNGTAYAPAGYDDGGIVSAPVRGEFVAVNGAPVRAGPNEKAREIARLPFGKGIAVRARVEDVDSPWYLVKTGYDTGGYVAGGALRER